VPLVAGYALCDQCRLCGQLPCAWLPKTLDATAEAEGGVDIPTAWAALEQIALREQITGALATVEELVPAIRTALTPASDDELRNTKMSHYVLAAAQLARYLGVLACG
jgi:hypothetical protein